MDSREILSFNKSQLEDLAYECLRSSKLFAQVFMPDRFWRPFNRMHDQIFDFMDNDSIKKGVIKAPRGVGKSTLFNIVLPAKKILYRMSDFIIMVGASNVNAEQMTENLKDELTTNEAIQRVFGDIKSGTFAKEKWVTDSGIMVMPRGAGQKVRGLLHRSRRPDLFIIDDLENDENVENEEQRKKLERWFHAAVVNSVDKASPYRIMVIGTLLHEDGLLAHLLGDKDWEKIELSICDPGTFQSNYPELLSDDEIKSEMEGHRQRGTLDVFYREYMGLPIADENRGFKQEMFRRYSEVELRERVRKGEVKLENVILVDPARTVNATSDYSAILCVGVDLLGGSFYFRDLKVAKLHPDELYDAVFEMAETWKAKAVGLEVTSLNEFILYPFKNAMVQRKAWMEVIELKARGQKKEDRIYSLQPFYRRGQILHNDNGCCNVLEGQLMACPRGVHDDAADCAAYLIEMMELGEQYFFGAATEQAQLDEYGEMLKEDLRDKYEWQRCCP